MKRIILLLAYVWIASSCLLAMTTATPASTTEREAMTYGNQIVKLRVSRVIDGDTFEGYIDNGGNPGVNPLAIELNRLTIRICGIDAPECGQYYGDVATRYLNFRIGGETVYLELIRKDRYGRWVAKVSINGLDIAGEMLKHGLAWYYKEYETIPSYAQLEAGARLRRLGLWRDDRAVPPWEWRKMSKAERDLYR